MLCALGSYTSSCSDSAEHQRTEMGGWRALLEQGLYVGFAEEYNLREVE